MSKRRLKPLAVAATLAAVACGAASSTPDSPAPQSSRDQITAAEILATNTSSVFDAIRRLRPTWLRPRGGNASPPVVYVDGVRSGDLSYLKTLRVEGVHLVRYVNSRNATTRWGTGHASGAIEVFIGTGGG